MGTGTRSSVLEDSAMVIENREKTSHNTAVEKQHIVNEIKRTAAQNDGKALGERAFSQATGIMKHEWIPKLWPRFSAAVKEAGFAPQEFNINEKYEDEYLLEKYARLAQKINGLPTLSDLRHQKASGADIPNSATYDNRFETKRKLVSRLSDYCASRAEFADVRDLCANYLSRMVELPSVPLEPDAEMGYVYLFRMGKHWKLGRTNDLLRRGREIKTLLPEKCDVVHSFRTDDPTGIEAYWHRRFESKRCEGEWFVLTAKDIAAFKKRRTFM